jgi:uncharacterized protein (TIGR00661 family)
MKLLYGVQATGNGHISRARTMACEFAHSDIEVDYLFSGRPRDDLFNMEPFGDYRCLRGLTFYTRKGRILKFKTLTQNSLTSFFRDVRNLDLSHYDLVLTDYEPVTAWAARLQGKHSIGVGHQYAFHHDIPVAGDNFLTSFIMKSFAPAKETIGLHWHHYNCPILPPLIEHAKLQTRYEDSKILVYMAFDDVNDIVDWLRPVKDYDFYIYSEVKEQSDDGNIHLRPYSRKNFLEDLVSCSGVISNAGFVLLSEAIQYGKKVLVQPVKGQMEQISNAVALKQLGYGEVIHHHDTTTLMCWLDMPNPEPRPYPNVARAIVDWIQSGMTQDTRGLARKVWSQYQYI